MKRKLSSFAEGDSSSIPPATGSSTINVGMTERIASIISGTTLAVASFKNWNKVSGKLLAAASLFLLKRGSTGYCEVNNAIGRNTAQKKANALEVKASFIVNKPKEEIFSFWRNFENLPAFMEHLERIEVENDQRSHWTAKLPGKVGSVSWEAVIQEEQPNKLISWCSLPGSTIDNAGEVKFSDAGFNSTKIEAKISYRLPGGDVGSVAGQLFNPLVEKMIENDLKRFKTKMELGEIPQTKSGRNKPIAR